MTTKDNKLLRGCNKRKTEELGALRIREEDIDELLEEIRRKYQFDEEIDIDNDEKITNTNEVDEMDWTQLTLGPKQSRLPKFLYSNTKYTKGRVYLCLHYSFWTFSNDTVIIKINQHYNV